MLSNIWSALAPDPAPATGTLAGQRAGPAAARPGGVGDLSAGALLSNARHLELVLCRFRYAVAALAVMMAAGRPPFPAATALGLLLVPVAMHAGVRLGLRRAATPAAARRLGQRVLAADTAVALTVYLLFLPDHDAIPASFVPLIVFELAVRFEGPAGLAAGFALFAAAVGVRIFYQLRVIPGGSLRWPLLLVWILLAVLIVVLAGELRAENRMRLAAQRERERVADSFQLVVGEILTRSGVAPHEATWADVLSAVRSLCDQEPAECATLAAGIADLLVPASQAFGLTRREQEILRLLALGYPYQQIARALFVSGSTVRNHVHNVKSKLGLSSRDEVIEFAQRLAAPSGQPRALESRRDRPQRLACDDLGG